MSSLLTKNGFCQTETFPRGLKEKKKKKMPDQKLQQGTLYDHLAEHSVSATKLENYLSQPLTNNLVSHSLIKKQFEQFGVPSKDCVGGFKNEMTLLLQSSQKAKLPVFREEVCFSGKTQVLYEASQLQNAFLVMVE